MENDINLPASVCRRSVTTCKSTNREFSDSILDASVLDQIMDC